MKIQELINDLEKIKAAHPESNVSFEWLEYLVNNYESRRCGIVDCRYDEGCAKIRIASPLDISNLKELLKAENDQRR
jgi:hypothetical protein